MITICELTGAQLGFFFDLITPEMELERNVLNAFSNLFFNQNRIRIETETMVRKRLTRKTRQENKKRDENTNSEENQEIIPPPAKRQKLSNLNPRESLSSNSSAELSSPKESSENPTTDDISPSSSSQNEVQKLHNSAGFQHYLSQVRSKAIPGTWKSMDYEDVASKSRYTKVATWLRENKPELDQLTYNGVETGFYKCRTCAKRGNLHIIKACTSTNMSQFKIQNVQKHFGTKAHLDVAKAGSKISFSAEWRREMYVQYLKLMASQHVSGNIFKSDEFVNIITSWINQATNSRVDPETVKNELPSRRTLQRQLHNMKLQVTGKFSIFYIFNFFDLLQYIAIFPWFRKYCKILQ